MITKPTSIVSWILAIVGLLVLGLFLFSIVCLTAISAIGELDENQPRDDRNTVQISNVEFGYDDNSNSLSYSN